MKLLWIAKVFIRLGANTIVNSDRKWNIFSFIALESMSVSKLAGFERSCSET